jgi:hypothetical protein
MEAVNTIIATILGIFAIVGGVYQFYRFLKSHKSKKDLENSSNLASNRLHQHMNEYLGRQQKELATWRLFDFYRDIRLEDIYVQEILHSIIGGGPLSVKRTVSPPIPEIEILENIIDPSKTDDHVYIFMGGAGAGKSTLIRSWALTITKKIEQNGRQNGVPLPLYLSLRHLTHSTEKNTDGRLTVDDFAYCLQRTIPGLTREAAVIPFEFAQKILHQEGQRKSPSRLGILFGKRRSKSRPIDLVFLCDGLDEMSAETRTEFFHWAKGLSESVRLVITTRPSVLNDTAPSIPHSRMFVVADLNDEQKDTFIKKWFRDDTLLSDQLIQSLASQQSLRNLASIPLLLTCICMDVEVNHRVAFPDKLLDSDVLKRTTEILLDRWDAMKESRQVNYDMIDLGIGALSELALKYPFNAVIKYNELNEHVHSIAKKLKLDRQVADGLLQKIITDGRILVGAVDSGFSFGHAVIFDFFFATGVAASTSINGSKGN